MSNTGYVSSSPSKSETSQQAYNLKLLDTNIELDLLNFITLQFFIIF